MLPEVYKDKRHAACAYQGNEVWHNASRCLLSTPLLAWVRGKMDSWVGKEKKRRGQYLTIFRESHGLERPCQKIRAGLHLRINALSPVVSLSCVSRQQSTVIQIILGPEGAGAEKKSFHEKPCFRGEISDSMADRHVGNLTDHNRALWAPSGPPDAAMTASTPHGLSSSISKTSWPAPRTKKHVPMQLMPPPFHRAPCPDPKRHGQCRDA